MELAATSPDRPSSSPSQILTQDEIDEKAWYVGHRRTPFSCTNLLPPRKYTGYRGFTSFVASDPDFFVVRRFDRLNARVLLTLQDNLSLLEERLEVLDGNLSAKNAGDVNNGSVRDDIPDRAALLSEMCNKLKDYSTSLSSLGVIAVVDEIDTILLSHSKVRSWGPAPDHAITNVENWFYNNDGAIVEKERRFITHKEDLISISKLDKPSMRRFLERHIVFRSHWLWKQDPPSDTRDVDRVMRRYEKDEKIDFVTTIVMLLVGMIMLLVPIWTLAVITTPFAKLGVITTFIVLFLLVVSYATIARPWETLAATAA